MQRTSKVKCQCGAPGFYALYELRDNLTKIWRTNLCSVCDRRITRNNEIMKKAFDVNVFVEVFDGE